MAEQNEKTSTRRHQEPHTIDTTPTGNHPAGNYLGSDMLDEGRLPDPAAASEIWIDQTDHAKQGMARKSNLREATAAPNHPHVGHSPGSGDMG